VRELGLAIVRGELQPGDKLPPEAQLLERYEISRPVLREAVRVLVAKGLVMSRQRAGAIVRPRNEWHLLDPDVLYWLIQARPQGDFVQTLMEVRQIFEPAAAALAARDVQAVAHDAHVEALPAAQHVRRAVPPVAPGAVEHHPPHGAAAPARVPAAEQVQVAAAEHGAAEPVGLRVLARHGRQRAPRAAGRVEHVPRHAPGPVPAVALHGVQPLLREPEPPAEAVEVVAREQAAPPSAHQPQLPVVCSGHPDETGNGEVVRKAREQRALPSAGAPVCARPRLQRVDGRPEARLHARLRHRDSPRRGGGGGG